MKSYFTRFLILLLASSLTLIAEEPWFSQNSGTSSNLRSVFFANKLVGYAAGEGGVILKTTNGGSVWNDQTSGTTETLNSVVFVSVSLGWVCGNNNVIRKTTNGGTTWTNTNHGIPVNNTFNGIVFTDNSYGYVVGQFVGDVTKSVVYSTNDGGASWTQTLFDDRTQYFTSVHFPNSINGWVTANNGRILHTTDGGTNWIYQSYAANRSIFFTDDSVGWASGDGNGIYWTSDGGTNWNSNNASQMSFLNDVHFINRTEGYAVGSPSDTVVKSINGGRTWKSLPTKTAGRVFNSVFFVNSDTGWVVGSGGMILKTVNGGETPTGIHDDENIPASVHLYQNYPNPFNPKTDFRFRISDFRFVSLKVFNILGKEVATLVHEKKTKGEHSIEWDATGFPSGIYFYKLQAGSFIEVKKMLLSK
ncbi:MAG: T9SS type A sorting domain-containing protein [Ignavibacteriae bacterium]|nr:T9SS type A sorting domain-containing protein [Ignavibacteriota bacterium]